MPVLSGTGEVAASYPTERCIRQLRLTKNGQLRCRHGAMQRGGYWMFLSSPGALPDYKNGAGAWFGNRPAANAMATASVPISSTRGDQKNFTLSLLLQRSHSSE
jgi:hypothetical protein